jgi:hypothetical protein
VTPTSPPLCPDSGQDPNEDPGYHQHDPEHGSSDHRNNASTDNNNEDAHTEGNVLVVRCVEATVTVTTTPTRTLTQTPTSTATAAGVTPTSVPAGAAPAQAPAQAPAFSAPSLSIHAAGADPDDGVDLPYVVIANVDGRQKVRLSKDAATSCPAIRVGDYLDAEGTKQNEQLFDADDVAIEHVR